MLYATTWLISIGLVTFTSRAINMIWTMYMTVHRKLQAYVYKN